MPQSKRTTSGMGSIRKITREVNGKTYTASHNIHTELYDGERCAIKSACLCSTAASIWANTA